MQPGIGELAEKLLCGGFLQNWAAPIISSVRLGALSFSSTHLHLCILLAFLVLIFSQSF